MTLDARSVDEAAFREAIAHYAELLREAVGWDVASLGGIGNIKADPVTT